MTRYLPYIAATVLVLVLAAGQPALAQKQGGVLKMPHGDSPASMSIHEESTIVAEGPMMAVFNNLVMFDQHIAQNSMSTIVPDLGTEWAWSADGKDLTFKLRGGVKWHDGKPFTAADVKCTWDLLTGKAQEKFRVNPRKSWWRNLDSVTVNGDLEAVFHLKRPQPSFIGLLASGWSPVYPCHIPPAQMRQHPIGTGPFKFVEFKPNESIKLVKNADYWKPGRPYLDGIDYTIIKNTSTWILALGAKQFDRTGPGFVAPALMKELKSQAPDLNCQIDSWNTTRTLITNRAAPPFDNPDIRKAIALALDRKAFIDIIGEGEGYVGPTLQPPPEGVWGMPPEMIKTLFGYDPDVAKNRAQAARDHAEARLWPGQAPRGDCHHPQRRGLSRSRGDPDRPIEGHLHRRHAQRHRHPAMVSDRDAQGFHHRLHRHRDRARRPGPDVLRKLLLRLGAELHRLLRPRDRPD